MAAKRVTSQDVADLAGVSRTTVSLVLNDVKGYSISPGTREKVRNAARELGYIPDAAAQALASRKSKAIGLVMTRSPYHVSTDSFLPQIIAGLLDVIRENKLRLLVESVDREHQDTAYLELVRAKHIDGMILLTPRTDDSGLMKLLEGDIPTVLMGTFPDSGLFSVDVDNRLAARRAVEYLLQLGHKGVAFISNASLCYSSATERLLGYKDALQNAGIPVNEGLIRYADFDPASGFECMRSLLDAGAAFTAAFVASDNVAIGAASALKEAGLHIPGDVSLVGFDDIPWAKYTDPPLTTIHLPAQELARLACVTLIDLIQGIHVNEKKLELETNLVVRQSCRPI